MGFHRGPKIVTNGLVLYLDAANKKSYPGTGTAWTDLSGLGNTGTLTNGPTFNSGNGGSIVFDGVNDRIELGTPNSLIFTGNITIECWVKSTTASGVMLITGNWILPSSFNYGLFWNDTGSSSGLALLVSNSFVRLTTNPYIDGKWHHLCGVCVPGGISRLFVDSVQVASQSGGSISNSSYRWLIGSGDNRWPFPGNIGYTKIYNRALSSSEILQNYNATKSRFNL